jgi:hypothetical protein
VAFFDIRDGFRRKGQRISPREQSFPRHADGFFVGMASVTVPEDGGRATATANVGIPTAGLATANVAAGQNAFGRQTLFLGDFNGLAGSQGTLV